MVTYLVVTLISPGDGTTGTILVITDVTFLHQKPSYFLLKTITDLDILKGTLPIVITLHTVITIMVRPSVRDMIFMLQTMQIETIILVSLAARIAFQTATIMCGQEAIISAPMRSKFTVN